MTSGVLLVQKPTGISSAKALYPVKRRFPGQKIGHTGTLDPFAAGLLVVLVGHATRLSRLFLALDKRYVATVRFGRETETDDPEGATVKEAPLPNAQTISRILPRFHGIIDQVPPVYSALKVNGKRSYALARSGVEVSLPPRPVTIYDLNLTATSSATYEMSVHCGSGTYVRALARDIGRASHSAAYLETLCRTSVGPFSLTSVEDNEDTKLIPIPEAIEKLGGVPILTVSDSAVGQLRSGVTPDRAIGPILLDEALDTAMNAPRFVLCVSEQHREVALLELPEGKGPWRFAAVFPPGEAE